MNTNDFKIELPFEKEIFNYSKKYLKDKEYVPQKTKDYDKRKEIRKIQREAFVKKRNECLENLPSQEPLDIIEFCASPLHMNFPKLGPGQEDFLYGVFGTDKNKIFENGKNIGIALWGKGSGKDSCASMAFCYIIYWFLCHENPQEYLGLPPFEPLDLLNISITESSARTVFFDKFINFVLNWKWLRERYPYIIHGMPTARSVYRATEKVVVAKTSIIFPKRIRAFSANPESETWEGLNVIASVIDEASGFREHVKYRSPMQVFQMLKASSVSRFKEKFKLFILSYPRKKNDFIIRAFNWAKGQDSAFASKLTPWEAKPRELFKKETFSYEGREIPVDYKKEFIDDPFDAKRKFLCEVEDLGASLIPRTEVEACIDQNLLPIASFRDDIIDGKIVKGLLGWNYLGRYDFDYFVGVDLGLKRSCCAISLSRLDGSGRVIVDLITQWIPSSQLNIEVDLENVEQILNEILKGINVKEVIFDHWNSAYFVSKLQRRGVQCKAISLSLDQYLSLRSLFFSRGISIPNDKILIEQLINLPIEVEGYKDRKDLVDSILLSISTFLEEISKTNRKKKFINELDSEFENPYYSQDEGGYFIPPPVPIIDKLDFFI